jgi:multidrug efflux pump
MGGMIGETTLAMLYVPLFFYLFDRLTERLGKKEAGPAEPGQPPPAAAIPEHQEGN